jgi:YidC/Oxa1 family membrane protein insertase
MPVWSEFVDVIYATLVCVSTALGGSMGLAIAVVSLVARVALLPLTLRLAYRALEVQAAVKRIEPQLARLREKYKSDQRRMLEETARLYQANGIKLVDGAILVPAVLTLVILSRMAAGVSLYTLASGLVGLLQALLVRRRAAHLAAA